MKSTRDKLKVLIIDSPNGDIKDISKIFVEEGLTVYYVNNSDHGMTKILEVKPHIIILEAFTSPMNGFEFVRKIKNSSGKFSVIMCSNRNDSFDRVWAKEQGVDIYLVKPIGKEIIIKAAKKLLKSRMKK